MFMRKALLSILFALITTTHAAGQARMWYPTVIDFVGPTASETDSNPNPFLDYRLTVTLQRPDGTSLTIPGFFDGDGNGAGEGNIWRIRFAPDLPGTWSYTASFRSGNNVATSLEPTAGTPASFDGQTGTLDVLPRDPNAPGFLSQGLLEYVGGHYLKFRDGDFWIKGGVDSPENFLGYDGFDNTVTNGFVHRYPTHVADWNPGDPNFQSADTGYDGRAIIGALNYLASENVNSIYFLPMNLGGDGKDTYPFVGRSGSSFDNTHYDISKLAQWTIVLDHAQRLGIAVNIVLNETEGPNENWLDDGLLGVERRLFYRELAARFGFLLAKKWNLCEENDFPVPRLNDFADFLGAQDYTDAPITVHTRPNSFGDYNEIVGDPRYSATSIQYSPDLAGQHVENWRNNSAAAGRPWVLDMDENAPASTGLNSSNAEDLRKRVLWDVYLSGGNIEWYFGGNGQPEGGDQNTEDFRTREEMYRYMWFARRLILDELPFNDMVGIDSLVSGEDGAFGGAQVFARPGTHYAVYLPNASGAPTIDLTATAGSVTRRWYNPENGEFAGETTTLAGGAVIPIGTPPGRVNEDWVILFVDADGVPQVPTVTALRLIDAQSDTPVAGFEDLRDGTVIDLSTLDTTALSIEALANSITGSVEFTFTDPAGNRVESARPFALFGDSGGDFAPWQPAPGSYTLSATPFGGADASGGAGATVAITFSVTQGGDSDGDGVADSADNCTFVANADQRDSNGDGFGNLCDPDLDNNNVVNVEDLGLLRSVFFTSDADADLNGDGVVNVIDLGIMQTLFFQPPGPSGFAGN